jgi:hypothetical protein
LLVSSIVASTHGFQRAGRRWGSLWDCWGFSHPKGQLGLAESRLMSWRRQDPFRRAEHFSGEMHGSKGRPKPAMSKRHADGPVLHDSIAGFSLRSSAPWVPLPSALDTMKVRGFRSHGTKCDDRGSRRRRDGVWPGCASQPPPGVNLDVATLFPCSIAVPLSGTAVAQVELPAESSCESGWGTISDTRPQEGKSCKAQSRAAGGFG